MRISVFSLLVTLLFATEPAVAQTQSSNPLGSPIAPALLNGLTELKRMSPWNMLGQVKGKTIGNRVVPEFNRLVVALDRHEVKRRGLMLPIVAGEVHDRFC
jgi:hypothetical protein